jgi:hypothetical protein
MQYTPPLPFFPNFPSSPPPPLSPPYLYCWHPPTPCFPQLFFPVQPVLLFGRVVVSPPPPAPSSPAFLSHTLTATSPLPFFPHLPSPPLPVLQVPPHDPATASPRPGTAFDHVLQPCAEQLTHLLLLLLQPLTPAWPAAKLLPQHVPLLLPGGGL